MFHARRRLGGVSRDFAREADLTVFWALHGRVVQEPVSGNPVRLYGLVQDRLGGLIRRFRSRRPSPQGAERNSSEQTLIAAINPSSHSAIDIGDG
jgi:hypothetical protein